MAVSPIHAGLNCRCPACGHAPLYRSFLEIRQHCDECNADLSVAATADGPAFFVMLAVMILIVPAAMICELVFSPPIWVHILIWPPVVLGLSMILLRPCKSLLFALQWANDAREARLDDSDI